MVEEEQVNAAIFLLVSFFAICYFFHYIISLQYLNIGVSKFIFQCILH